MPQTIEITVSPQGETRIETKGFVGPSCRDATRDLEAAMGLRISEQPTAEFHVVATPEQQPQRQ